MTMISLYKNHIPVLDYDDPSHRDFFHPRDASYGLTPRDLKVDPVSMFASPDGMDTVPQSEWDARYDEQEKTKSSLEHLYLSGPNGDPLFVNLDQDGVGYCWTHSSTHSVMLERMAMGLPHVRLSAFAIGCMVKNFRDEGGWCGASAKFARDKGIPSVALWPEQSMQRSNDNAATWADAAKHKIVRDWVDLTKGDYDQNLSAVQFATCGFLNIPAPSDFNWWGHSVCQVRWVRIEAGSWGPLILNSWKGWGRHGLAVLQGSKATANGGVATRGVTLSLS